MAMADELHPDLVVAVKAANDWLTDYEKTYEFCGDDGYYTPNEQEAVLISDALAGVMDEDFVTLMGKWYIERQKQRAADGDCLDCGAPKGQHWGNCPTVSASVPTEKP